MDEQPYYELIATFDPDRESRYSDSSFFRPTGLEAAQKQSDFYAWRRATAETRLREAAALHGTSVVIVDTELWEVSPLEDMIEQHGLRYSYIPEPSITGLFFPRAEDAEFVESDLLPIIPEPIEEDGMDQNLYQLLIEDFDPERVNRYVDSHLLETRSREAVDRRFELWCWWTDTAEERLRELAARHDLTVIIVDTELLEMTPLAKAIAERGIRFTYILELSLTGLFFPQRADADYVKMALLG